MERKFEEAIIHAFMIMVLVFIASVVVTLPSRADTAKSIQTIILNK